MVGYVSYLAACEMNQAFSEYVLYEPILRILTARKFDVRSEVICPGVEQPATGDKKKIDFVATRQNGARQKLEMAVEVKWARSKTVDLESDILKLVGYLGSTHNARAFICVFGRHSCIGQLQVKRCDTLLTQSASLTPFGDTVIAEFGQTKYSCLVYELVLSPAARKKAF